MPEQRNAQNADHNMSCSRRPSAAPRSSGFPQTRYPRLWRRSFRILSRFRPRAILDTLPCQDVVARGPGTLPSCLTALPLPQLQIERLEKRLPHANTAGCVAHRPKPSFHARAQHGAPNMCGDESVRDLDARQDMQLERDRMTGASLFKERCVRL